MDAEDHYRSIFDMFDIAVKKRFGGAVIAILKKRLPMLPYQSDLILTHLVNDTISAEMIDVILSASDLAIEPCVEWYKLIKQCIIEDNIVAVTELLRRSDMSDTDTKWVKALILYKSLPEHEQVTFIKSIKTKKA